MISFYKHSRFENVIIKTQRDKAQIRYLNPTIYLNFGIYCNNMQFSYK